MYIYNKNINYVNNLKDICSGKTQLPITSLEPCFATWNWPVIRACAFWLCTLSVVACGVAVGYTLATMPKTCDPKTTWYRGGVFYEAQPLVFSDFNGDGIGDLRGIAARLVYIPLILLLYLYIFYKYGSIINVGPKS